MHGVELSWNDLPASFVTKNNISLAIVRSSPSRSNRPKSQGVTGSEGSRATLYLQIDSRWMIQQLEDCCSSPLLRCILCQSPLKWYHKISLPLEVSFQIVGLLLAEVLRRFKIHNNQTSLLSRKQQDVSSESKSSGKTYSEVFANRN